MFISLGVIPIPLPLAIPVGFRQYDFTVANGQVQDVRILLSKYGASTGIHLGFTFDESGNTLNSAWVGRHPFWGGDEAFGNHIGIMHECFRRNSN